MLENNPKSSDDVKNKPISIPDIATYGIMNLSTKKREVILRKVEQSTYDPLLQTSFTFDILRYDRTPVVVNKTSSGDLGAFFVDLLPYGTYYLHEKDVPEGYTSHDDDGNWYTLTVDENGVGFKEGANLSNTLNPEAEPNVPGSNDSGSNEP
jgi:uncharacterized surface anchored protein